MTESTISKTPVVLVLLIYGAGLGSAFQFAKLATSFPFVQEIYPAPEPVQGLLVSIISLVGIVLGLVAGQIVARFGMRRMMIVGLCLGAAMSLAQALLPPLWLFLLSRSVEGLSHLAIVVAAPTLMNQICRPQDRYLAMTLWSSFFSVAFAISAAVGPTIIATLGLSALYVAHGIYMIVFAGILLVSLPRDLRASSHVSLGLKDIWNRHVSAYLSPSESAAALGWLFYTLTFVSILTVMPQALPEAQRSLTVPLMPIASICTSFTIGAWMLRHRPAVLVIQIGFVCSAACAFVFFLLPPNGWVLVALFAALGLVQAASFAAIPQLNDSAEKQALATGALAQMGNLGNTLGPPVLLTVLALAGVSAVPLLLVVCYLAGAFLHAWLARKRASATAS